MKPNFLSATFVTLSLVLYPCFAAAQSNEIKIVFKGNCGLYLTDGNLRLYTDFPYKSGAHKYMEYDESELSKIEDGAIFLFTHRHTDHYSRKLVKKAGGEVYGNWNTGKLEELNARYPDFSIQAFKTSHKFTFKHYSYLITWHGKTIYLNGDTGDTEPISKLRNLDWAFMPYWLFTNANSENIPVEAEMIGIYHLAPVQIPGIPDDWGENVYFLTRRNEAFSIPY